MNYVKGSESAGEKVALTSACKEKTLREVRRVLKPAGSVHMLDFKGAEADGSGVVRQIVVHHIKKVFLSPWRRFFGLGLHADSSIRENARRERGLCLAGFQKRIWLSEKQLLNLRCHRITMVQATESRKGLNLPFHAQSEFL